MSNLFQKGITLALTIGVSVSMILPASAAMYNDVNWHWAKKDIQKMTDLNVFEGYNDGTFRPNRNITRAEFVQVLMKALGMNRGRASANFSDVSSNHWAAPLIGMADAKNLVEGYPDNEFRPSAHITRAEALSILSKVTLGPAPGNAKIEQILKNYRDGYRVPEWDRAQVAKAIHYDVFKSAFKQSNAVLPYQKVTRGETAYLLNNLLRHNELARQAEIEVHHKWAKVVPDQSIRFPQGIDRRRTKSTYTVTVATPISSEFTTEGDEVTVVLNEKLVTSNGVTIAPGSKIFGTVNTANKANWGENGKVAFEFNRVMTPDGKEYDLKGTLATSDGSLRGDSNPAVSTPGSSYDALKAQIKSEAGAHSRHQKEDVFYKNIYKVETSANGIVDKNQDNFVLVGVGDKLEINFTGPAKLIR